MKKLIAVDGNSLMFRAYYAIQTAMTGRDGTPTNALHGFVSMLLKLIDMKPDYLLVAFDISGGTFRHDTYADYKAGRRETPEDLRPQFPALKQLLKDMGITVCECYRYEADDILGTVSRMAEEKGDISSLLVTGDRDALQLISDKTHVLLTKKGISETVEYDEAALLADYGLAPKRMIDLKALMGDSSDNIPGIKGIGEKTAKNLLIKYGDLDTVLANAENEKGALQKKLLEGVDSARMSYEIGTICRTAPIDITPEDCAFDPVTLAGGIPLLAKLGLRSNMARVKAIADSAASGPAPVTAEAEPDLPPWDDEPKAERQPYSVTEYSEISDKAALDEAVRRLSDCDNIAFYIDESLGIAADNGLCFTVRTGGDLLSPGLMPQEIFSALAGVFENASIGKILFDGKHFMNLLADNGAALRGLRCDLTVADYLLNALNPAKTLDALSEGMGVTNAHGLPNSAVGSTGAKAALMHDIRAELEAQLAQRGLMPLYLGVELPLVTVLFDMERSGFAVDAEALRAIGEGMSGRIAELETQIHELAGHSFNILSPKQLGTVLFDELGLPPQKKTKTGYSTDSDVLESLSGMNPIVEAVIEYRFLTKLRSTFVDAMLQKIGPDGRIHTTFNQNVTATGRISSAEPNLQNIPVRTEQGSMIRKAFIASPGCTLVGADYSQIELRVLAHMSGDDALKNAFISGADIHTRTAAEVFGVPLDMVTKQMRSAAKAVNFGIVYGISEFGLANQLGIPRRTAGEYIKKYLDRFTGVHNYMKRSVEQGRQLGYAATLTGRRRDLPELKSGNHNTRAFGERVAMNMPVQGTAADIIKLAMVRVNRSLTEGGFKAKLVLQIHDELIIDCPVDEVERVGKLLHDCMTGAPAAGELPETTAIGDRLRLSVPLIAEVAEGHSWFDTK